MARSRDRILCCVGRTRYPAKKSIRKAPAQKARRGIFAFGLRGQARKLIPVFCLKTQTPPRPMEAPAGWTEEQVWAEDPSPASGPDSPRGRVCTGATRRKVVKVKTAIDTAHRFARSCLAGKPRQWPVARCAWSSRPDP